MHVGERVLLEGVVEQAGAWLQDIDLSQSRITEPTSVSVTVDGHPMRVQILAIRAGDVDEFPRPDAPEIDPAAASFPQLRVQMLTGMLGVRSVARLLKISASQPSRWASGAETPSPAETRQIIELDHVTAVLMQVRERHAAVVWLASPNQHLDGATPMDVIRERGSQDVIAALDAELAGVYD